MDDDTELVATRPADEWWRSAVIYQIYPRSFADSDGDGIGDLAGVTARLDSLADLGIDAIWLSPFYRSPQNDAGYDVADYRDIDPLFGTLDDFDTMLHKAHELELRVIVDLVPNHSSDDHVWFKEALAAAPGSAERARYIFRDGRGPGGDLPPNNWESVFGGDAWTRVTEADGTPGQWYLHLFDSSQPDLDWSNRWVHEQFIDVLRFWLDRGVDGFRVDVAHGMVKAEGLPDWTPAEGAGSMGGAGGVSLSPGLESEAITQPDTPPYWAQDGVHAIFREWRSVLDEYEGDRVLCAEAWVDPLAKLALWVRSDEMDQAFNFTYLETPWSAPAIRKVVDDSIAAFSSVGAPSTWVLSNHDVVRHASRLALTAPNPQGAGVGPRSAGQPIPELGLRRARAATTLMLALPGSAYLYQGEELGLPEVVDLPDEAREDPTFRRTGGEKYGRDGCRVPIPWESDAPAYGFSPTGASWLPQPGEWSELARDAQAGVPGSTLELYRAALAERVASGLGTGALSWLGGFGDSVVAFVNAGVTVIANVGEIPVELPIGEVLLSSEALDGATLPPDTTVWLRTE
ncbi:glycoside hydrolase family 13 protein [Amnibacterium flavum]|uniref:Alpha-amylase n=1 Tax=Amnibacterium flavum TaxID=2173173 RepID=A0A2V1HUT5_9MICO|nr:glycoside hydrolase family 13 protein [Amnibacterium flavum]PVZ96343.1 alpha-amylase [Amnibacterium flavum]